MEWEKKGAESVWVCLLGAHQCSRGVYECIRHRRWIVGIDDTMIFCGFWIPKPNGCVYQSYLDADEDIKKNEWTSEMAEVSPFF